MFNPLKTNGRGYELKAEPQQIIKSTNQTEAFCL